MTNERKAPHTDLGKNEWLQVEYGITLRGLEAHCKRQAKEDGLDVAENWVSIADNYNAMHDDYVNGQRPLDYTYLTWEQVEERKAYGGWEY